MNESTYSLRIWTVSGLPEDFRLPKISGYETEITGDRDVERTAVPADIMLGCGGISHVTDITVSPVPPASVVVRINEFAEKNACGGVVEYLSEESGKRLVFTGEKHDFAPLNAFSDRLYLSVWAPPSAAARFDGKGLVSLLEECLPSAVPVKYGTNEAETDYVANGGAEGFDAFLKQGGFPVIYCSFPVTHMFFSFPDASGSRAFSLSLCMTAEVWENESWRYALGRLLRRLSCAVGAYFGQIVIGDRPVAAGFWKGIPTELGEACVIGGEYPAMIPGCRPSDGGELPGRPCSALGDGFAKDGEESGCFYYEEPNGPQIPSPLLSKRKKTLFGKPVGTGRGYPLPDDFTVADRIPASCLGKAENNG